jgi:F-type H+-transporting ATPase subunit a
MFLFLQENADKGFNAAQVLDRVREQNAAETPPIVEMVNHYIGKPVYNFEMAYTKPIWDKIFSKFTVFGDSAEKVFGAYTPENAVPWYTIMFILACIATLLIIWIFRGSMSKDEPDGGQQALEVSVLTIRGLVEDIVGPHGLKYLPVVATFSVLILCSNLLGFLPGMTTPTTSTSVTFAFGISSFVYYNYIGIKENGLLGHLGHFAGVNYFSGAMLFLMGPVMFIIELISNSVRPLSLSLRLFGNMFGDEQVSYQISHLYPPYTFFIVPALLMVLGVFAAVMQTFIFTLLSLIYIGEVSHAPHEHHGREGEPEVDGDEIIAPVLT